MRAALPLGRWCHDVLDARQLVPPLPPDALTPRVPLHRGDKCVSRWSPRQRRGPLHRWQAV
ncbi:hypothetical protein [Myxococcus sp. Y35]|uniref:hypothetical protein n=1 Tax=Pseudomyxococcus flavus TaxID=3115648 RepID=UPI003CEB2F89